MANREKSRLIMCYNYQIEDPAADISGRYRYPDTPSRFTPGDQNGFEKPSFRSYTENRCIILATGFYEWKWLDPKGKQKQKHRIWRKGAGYFAFAGLYSHWLDKSTGELIPTFTIITREAQGIMREIHNTKLRMPVVLLPEEEKLWLSGEIEIPSAPELEAEKI